MWWLFERLQLVVGQGAEIDVVAFGMAFISSFHISCAHPWLQSSIAFWEFNIARDNPNVE